MARDFIPVVHGAAGDRPDEADTLACAELVAATLTDLGHDSEVVFLDLDLTALDRLAARRPTLVFNLVEALCGEARLAHLPLWALDRLGLAYTGAPAHAMLQTTSKLLTKQALRASGVATPDWWEAGADVPAPQTVIVKSVWEHASLGIDAGSVVAGAAARTAVAARERAFGGTFFAEAFVDGREFNVALLEQDGAVRVLPMPEMTFEGLPADRPRIVDYEAKWAADSDAYALTVRRFGVEANEPALAGRLREAARACWRSFGLGGYARVDLRVDGDGRPWIVDVNANPCLAPDAGFAATAAAAGLSFEAVVAAIVAAARRPLRSAA